MVADLSASMGFVGAQRKLDVVADFAESLAWSAWRTGDSFGFVGCDEVVRADLLAAADALARRRQRARAAAAALQPSGRSARGLRDAHRHLPRQRALVFLVSDFHLPLPSITALLRQLAHHELVPVVLWDPLEFALTAPHGLAPLVDLESGRRRMVWWRPALRDKWLAAHAGPAGGVVVAVQRGAPEAAAHRRRLRCRCGDPALSRMSAVFGTWPACCW